MIPADPGQPLPPPERERLLDRFDRAWRTGPPPRIEDYLPAASGPLSNERRTILVELVKLDLEYRWRSANRPAAIGQRPEATCPRLDDYLRRFPELGSSETVPLELIGEEYRVRRCWGDRPEHREYLARFPRHGAPLRELLTRIEAELAAERGPRPVPSPAAAPGGATIHPITTANAFVAALRQLRLIRDAQLDELSQTPSADPRALARTLLERGLLTPYQANQVLQGQGSELLLGPYVILERLGEGGTGQVFKARHQKLQREAAVKLIRKELLADAELVRRFYREIRILSQMDHPHVVHAYDAGPVGPAHFLAMEHVEGIDLGKLVKQKGPLAAAVACEYIRQAASGLQHAHERGLVHRDIKPHNLMLAQAHGSQSPGLVKVLDLGLARLHQSANGEKTAALTEGQDAGLTPVGAALMGTADYLAPDQALDFHTADIRADIYSLGCTLFYLLTGQPPYPGGSLAQKVARHLQAEPPDIRTFRSDLPPELPAVLAKMLAKRPEDRYQTPAEVVAVLTSLLQRQHGAGAPRPRRRWVLAAASAGMLTALVLTVCLLWAGVFPPSPSPDRAATAKNLDELLSRLEDPTANPAELRQAILDFRLRCPGTLEAQQAAERYVRLPSPLDRLETHNLPEWQRVSNSPKVVAVLGQSGQSPARRVAFSPDARRLLTWGTDARLAMWDLLGASEPTVLDAHRKRVSCAAFSPDGRTLASGGEDGAVILWDVATGKTVASPLIWHKSALWQVLFAPDGRTLASVGVNDKVVRFWDLTAADARRSSVAGPTAEHLLAFSPDGRTLAVQTRKEAVRFWNLDAAARGAEPLEGTGDVTAAAYSPDGRTLIVSVANQIKAYGLTPRTEATVLKTQSGFSAATLDGKTLLGGPTGASLFQWEWPSGQELRKHRLPRSQRDDGTWPYFAFSLDGRYAAAADSDGVVYVLRLAAVDRPNR